MNSISELWSKRVKDYWNMAIRYLRLIGNSGFLFTIYLAIIVGSYYYSELLKWLPERFPATLFLAFITALFLTKSPLRTFVKEADIVFLSPIEGQLSRYFQLSLYYSFIVQSFIITLVIVILTPLYRHFNIEEVSSLVFIFIALLISKGWNLFVQWEEGRLLFPSIRASHQVTRFLVNFSLTYLLFASASIYFIGAILLIKVFLLFFYYDKIRNHHSLKWEYLIEVEERMVMSFYRIANMFTDVPKLRTKIKSRRVLSSITNFLALKQTSTFHFLYLKSFIRANDYLGIYIRLLVIGVVLIFYVQVDYASVFIGLLIIYMSALQLSTLWNHHSFILWLDLYPIDYKFRKKSFSHVIFGLLLFKLIIFTIVTYMATGLLIETGLLFVAGMGVCYVYSFLLLHKNRRSKS